MWGRDGKWGGCALPHPRPFQAGGNFLPIPPLRPIAIPRAPFPPSTLRLFLSA